MSDARRWTALGLAALSLPLMIMALIDPLEGALPLMAALLLTLAVRLLSRVPIPRVELCGIIAAVVTGLTAIAIVLLTSGALTDAAPIDGDAAMGNAVDLTARVMVWIYRAALIVAAVGAVQYLMRLVQTLLDVPVARQVRRSAS